MSTPVFVSKILPFTAQPLTEAARDRKLRESLDLRAERIIYGRQAILVSWAVFVIGFMALGASVFGWIMILPLKTIQNEIWVADSSTGIISKPVRLEDAPTRFGAATEQHFLYQYLMALERWVPETDREDDHLAKIMSSPEVQAQINNRRQKPDSNAVALGADGHTEIENVRFFPQFVDKDSQTRRYFVRFLRTVWKRGNKESGPEPWTASIDFEFHPERSMKPADRDLNPGGFVATAYSAKSDLPDQRRQQ